MNSGNCRQSERDGQTSTARLAEAQALMAQDEG